jgi:hypothetical protein
MVPTYQGADFTDRAHTARAVVARVSCVFVLYRARTQPELCLIKECTAKVHNRTVFAGSAGQGVLCTQPGLCADTRPLCDRGHSSGVQSVCSVFLTGDKVAADAC